MVQLHNMQYKVSFLEKEVGIVWRFENGLNTEHVYLLNASFIFSVQEKYTKVEVFIASFFTGLNLFESCCNDKHICIKSDQEHVYHQAQGLVYLGL